MRRMRHVGAPLPMKSQMRSWINGRHLPSHNRAEGHPLEGLRAQAIGLVMNPWFGQVETGTDQPAQMIAIIVSALTGIPIEPEQLEAAARVGKRTKPAGSHRRAFARIIFYRK